MSEQGPRVELREAVVVGTTGSRDLLADVFVPPAEVANGIGLLLIHGGGWQEGDRSQLRGYGFLLGRRGVTCVAPDYRLVDEGIWPAPLHDVKAALRWMRASADELGVDPARIGALGASSGGHLALLLAGTATSPNWEGQGGNPGSGTELAAAIGLYSPTRLIPGGEMLSEGVERLLGSDATADTHREASPIEHVHEGWGPVMLLHSNPDRVVPRHQSLDLYEALQAAGVPTELHMFEGRPRHAFDVAPAMGRLTAHLAVEFLERVCPDPETLEPEKG
jgi:acetyl esterase/lipase